MMTERVGLRRIIARAPYVVRQLVSPWFAARAPFFSRCGRCRLPWSVVKAHSTFYSESRGLFPLCEQCWRELATPERRLPYYRHMWALWGEWSVLDPTQWAAIETAVMRGE